jgi:ubiquitin
MNKKWMAATILILLAATSFAMQINVAIVEGGTFTLEVELTDTIEAVKNYIQAEVGVAPEDQTLLFDSQELADGRTLADYGIEAGDSLQLNVAGSVTDPGDGDNPDDSDGDGDSGGNPGDGSDPDDGDDTDDGDPEDPGTDGNEEGEGQPVYTTQNDSADRDEPGSTSSTTAPSTSSSAPSSPEYVDRLESGVQAFVRGIQAQEQAGE